MRYTGQNPNGINQIASGSVAISVENTRVATFGTNTLQVTGSTVLSSSVNIIGTLLVTGSNITSGSVSVIGLKTITGITNTIGTSLVTGSTILSSSLSVIGTETVTGTSNTVGTLLVTGSTVLSGSISTIGPITSSGTLSLVSGSAGVLIAQSLTQANSSGSYMYGVNVTPTLTNNAPSQTQTAFRVNATFTGSYTGSSTSNVIADFGAASVGSQLTITDVTSGSIYMVNDVSGLPIIEATSDWTVNMYNYPNVVLKKTGSALLLGVSGSTGSLVTVQASSSFVGPASFTQPTTFRNDIVFDEGFGASYRMLQVSSSTTTAVPTASLYTLGLNTSSSVSMIALITGYGTGSRDTVTGEIRSTVKRVGGNASIVGTNIRFITADFSGSDANIVVSGSNAILVVTGSTAEPYAWRATITTQIV